MKTMTRAFLLLGFCFSCVGGSTQAPFDTPRGNALGGGIAFRAQSTYWAWSMDTMTIDLVVPATVQANDALIANIYVGDYSTPSLPVITAPAGWTLVRQISHGTAGLLLIYSRVAVAADAGATFTWTSDGWVGAACSLLAYSGVDPAAPVEVSAVQDNVASAATYATPAVTTQSASAMLIATYAAYTQNINAGQPSTSWSTPAGTTQRVNINNNGKLLSISNDELVQAAAGASGTFSSTANLVQDYALTALVALKPAGTCSPTTCAAQGRNCGTLLDGCGGTLSCGTCTAPQTCGGGGTAGVCGAGAVDPFGVAKVYPTKAGGREWYLPATADVSDAEWKPSSGVTKVAAGVFHTDNVQVRSAVASPSGKAWWRNVEITGYVRQTAVIAGSLAPHWSWYARGERHSHNATAPGDINGGVSAPAGTATWPGYPFSGTSVNPACLGTAYHSLLYNDGRTNNAGFEKEISHTAGYVAASDRRGLAAVPLDLSQWTGYKYVLRNDPTQNTVTMEIWVDAPAGAGWRRVSVATDSGGWNAAPPGTGETFLDGCDAAPFNYVGDQKITWAGPFATFRSDSVGYDFKWYSVREIDEGP